MPFSATPSRSADDLLEFFQVNLKGRIEREKSFSNQYVVRRSDDSFDITERIVQDVFTSDIVLCDLSGENSNPNVMYELGMRLALTNKPVILFREKNPKNKRIFDIQGFYAFEYTPTQYRKLEDHIITKLNKYENGEERYESPILKILKREPGLVAELQRKRVAILMESFRAQAHGLQRVFGSAVQALMGSRFPDKSENVDNLLLSFHQKAETLRGENWAHLVFHPRVPPALHSYLNELPLDGLVQADIEVPINTYMVELFNFYFASDYAWSPATFTVAQSFITEMKILRDICAGTVYLIRNPDGEKVAEVKKAITDRLRSSLFDVFKSSGTGAGGGGSASAKSKRRRVNAGKRKRNPAA